MNTPPPVNLSALKNILANAKKVMEKVEGDKPSTPSRKESISESSSSSQPIYDENDEREPVYENFKPTTQGQSGPRNYTAEQVMSSKLPDSVKKLMISKPIPQLQGIPSSFTLDDVQDVVVKKPTTKLNENSGANMVTVSQDQLQKMINESVANYFKADYEKRITEAAIKKTINVLIKEGKLNVKKK